jgi:SAM-dependent methyltransferase
MEDIGVVTSSYNADFYAARRDGSLQSAGVIVPILLSYVRPRSVADVGCGLGTWLKVFQQAGITDVVGYDGDYVDRAALLIEPSRFCPTDLRDEGWLERHFDLVISLEVAEHLPAECARSFVRRLTSAAPTVLFSAAIPGQTGTGHVNEQWQDYWRNLFFSEDFHPIDIIRPTVWGSPEVDFWYQQNTILYCSADFLAAHSNLKTVARRASLNLVHPVPFEGARQLYLGRVLKALPRLLKAAIVRRIWPQNR